MRGFVCGAFVLGLGCQSPGATDTNGSTGDEASTDGADAPSESEETPYVCLPGEQRCSEAGGIETCDDSGLMWNEEACARYESCIVCVGDEDPLCEGLQVRCSGPCDPGQDGASSLGCSFVTTWMPRDLEYNQTAQVVQVSNPDPEREATVQLLEVPMGEREEVPVGEAVVLQPGEHHRFELEGFELISTTTLLRTGSLWRVASDLPVAAHQWAPYDYVPAPSGFGGSGGGTALLPEDAFLGDFVAVSRNRKPAPFVSSSYFIVIALEDDTTVRWTPPHPTVGNGLPVPPAAAGEEVEVLLNRYDWVRVHVEGFESVEVPRPDVSGTVIESDRPIAAFAGVPCSYVPADPPWGSECDHLQEQLLPLNFWGQSYVMPAPPNRGADDAFELRIFAAGAGEVSETTGSGLGPWNFGARGEWASVMLSADDFAAGEAGLVLQGDVAFMPVLYLRSHTLNNGVAPLDTGDPAMTQLPPTEQFVNRQTVSTPQTFFANYAQVIRPDGAAEVRANGTPVDGWTSVGGYEVAQIALGPDEVRVLESDEAFGVLRYGFMGNPDDPLEAAAYAGIGALGFAELTTP